MQLQDELTAKELATFTSVKLYIQQVPCDNKSGFHLGGGCKRGHLPPLGFEITLLLSTWWLTPPPPLALLKLHFAPPPLARCLDETLQMTHQ